MRKVLVVLVVVAVSSCAAAPFPVLLGQQLNNSGDPYVADELGPAYCQRVGANADSRSQGSLITGVIMTVVAAGAVAIGGLWGPDIDPSATALVRNRNAVVIASGGLLGIPAGLFLAHSQASSEASSMAISAMALEDSEAMKVCLQARSVILSARASAAISAKSSLDASMDKVKSYKNEVQELEKKLETAPGPDKGKIQQQLDKTKALRDEAERELQKELHHRLD